jgi:hypothetical protein
VSSFEGVAFEPVMCNERFDECFGAVAVNCCTARAAFVELRKDAMASYRCVVWYEQGQEGGRSKGKRVGRREGEAVLQIYVYCSLASHSSR